MVYLDIWTLDIPLMIVIDPRLCAEATQNANLHKHGMLKDLVAPLTKGEDINTLNGETWKFWRVRFSPRFSAGWA